MPPVPTPPTEQDVLAVLGKILDPDLGRDVVSLGMIKDVQIDEAGGVAFTFELTTPAFHLLHKFQQP